MLSVQPTSYWKLKTNRHSFHILILLNLACAQTPTKAQEETFVIVNIGFKFGYAMSEQSSFLGGLEVSVNFYQGHAGFGFLASTEQWTVRTLDHYAVQAFWGFAGASFGPTSMKSPNDTTSGYSTTFFGGAIVLPYYRYTTLRNGSDAHEIGIYAKLPVPLLYPKIRM